MCRDLCKHRFSIDVHFHLTSGGGREERRFAYMENSMGSRRKRVPRKIRGKPDEDGGRIELEKQWGISLRPSERLSRNRRKPAGRGDFYGFFP